MEEIGILSIKKKITEIGADNAWETALLPMRFSAEKKSERSPRHAMAHNAGQADTLSITAA